MFFLAAFNESYFFEFSFVNDGVLNRNFKSFLKQFGHEARWGEQHVQLEGGKHHVANTKFSKRGIHLVSVQQGRSERLPQVCLIFQNNKIKQR